MSLRKRNKGTKRPSEKASERTETKGEVTRRHVYHSALALFRRRGFESTTMRDVAESAGLSLGAAYHYFPSKDAILLAYYEWIQAEHERLATAAQATQSDLGGRLSALIETKLDLLRRDRKLLAALFANLGDAAHPLSLFGPATADVRGRSLGQFLALFEGDGRVPADLREVLGYALWLGHLGVFLYFIHDTSPKQVRTRQLVSALVDLVASGLPWLVHPLAAPIRERVVGLVKELRR